ncbi:MAG: DUF3850 domain-containing protein [Desulfobaccales bacterium]
MSIRPRKRHELKCWPEFFQPTLNAHKCFELRRDDRLEGFQVGDELLLREWVPGNGAHQNPGYTGREVLVRVDYIMTSETVHNLMSLRSMVDDYVIMSISRVH